MDNVVKKRRVLVDITSHIRKFIDPNKSPDDPGGNEIRRKDLGKQEPTADASSGFESSSQVS